MPIKKYELDTLAPPRVAPEVSAAKQQLVVAHTTLQGVFESLHVVRSAARQDRDNRGRLTEGETDLLRAAVVLAGAGMEAVIKRLLTDCLPTILARPDRHPLAVRKYKEHVRAHLQDKRTPGAWLEAIVSDDPRPQMTHLYVSSLVRGSIQSEGELRAIRDALGLSVAQVSDEAITGLKGVLTARNQIAHDLDLRKPSDPGTGKRYKRQVGTVQGQCNDVLALTTRFVLGVSDVLKNRRST